MVKTLLSPYSNFSNFDKEILLSILHFKSHGLRIIDTHVHPLDVMGVYHHSNHDFCDLPLHRTKILTKASLIEKFKFGRVVNILANYYCKVFQGSVNNEIREKYSVSSKKRLITEMNISMVDKSVLVPLEPIVSTRLLYEHFLDRRLLLLGSIDIHGTKYEEIKFKIIKQVQEFNIIGFKLHPNLQNFYPIPSKNKPDIEEKLKLIYKICEDNKLFILIHGGTSFFTQYVDERYGAIQRSTSKAILQNFFYDDEKTIFDDYNIPFIIAHLGHYGINKLQDGLIKILCRKDNIFFDTAGTSPSLIAKMIKLSGYERIIFGTDAIYNKQSIGILFLCQAIKKVYGKLPIDILSAVFFDNFHSKVLYRNNNK